STYVAGQQQFENPDYYARLSELESARARYRKLLAEVPPDRTGAVLLALASAAALSEVNRLQREVQNTPQFTYQPITLAYEIAEIHATKVALAGATVEVAVGSTSMKQYVEAESTSSAKGVANALPNDASGFSNYEPALDADSTLAVQAAGALGLKAAEVVRPLAQNAALIESKTLLRKGQNLDAAGALLLARDIDPESVQIRRMSKSFGIIANAGADLARLRLDAADFEWLTAPSTTSGNAKPEARPSGAISAAMRSIVTVHARNSQGSGFVWRKPGFVVTNAHVVGDEQYVRLRTSSGEEVDAQVVSSSKLYDLALLESRALDLLPLVDGDPDAIDLGSDVFALGAPDGLEGTVTKGILSARRKMGDGRQWLQVDAAINFGNSGGALTTPEGRVVGVVTSVRGDTEGIGFAQPITDVARIFGGLVPK
ncbi:MAG: S1C family serine protease, partial [Thermoanaerobaculia bacterium]